MKFYFVKIVYSLLFAVEIYSSVYSPNKLSQTVSGDVNSTTNDHRTFDGEKNLLKRMDELTDKVDSTSQWKDGNLTYSSFMTDVQENSTNITWQANTKNRPKVTILEDAARQLVHTTVKIVVFEEKNKSHYLSDIVAVRTAGLNENLNKSTIRIKFQADQLVDRKNRTTSTCVSWDAEISKWSAQGITTASELESVTCESRDLATFFSILPNPNEEIYKNTYNWSSFHKNILFTISRIGSTITICFLIGVIIIHYKKKTGKETSKILLNRTFALLLTHITYQIIILLKGDFKCLVIGFLKYYFALACLLWTAADGINMWRVLLGDVFNTRGHVFYFWCKIIGWGMPLVTTFIGLFCIKPQEGVCKLRFNKRYDFIFYMVPWALILSGNMLLFAWMFLNVKNIKRLGKTKQRKIDYVLALTQVFGISWCLVFPLLYFKFTHLLGEYLLAGIISTQGLLIFIVRGGTNIDKKFKEKLKTGSYYVSTWFRTNILKSPTGSATNRLQKKIWTVEFHTMASTDSEISYVTLCSK